MYIISKVYSCINMHTWHSKANRFFNGWMEMVEATPHFHMAMIFFVLQLMGNQFNSWMFQVPLEEYIKKTLFSNQKRLTTLMDLGKLQP